MCYGKAICCIGVRNHDYSILNKNTPAEYEKLLPALIKHMNDMPYVDNRGSL